MPDLADRISDGAVAALDLAPFDDRFGKLSRLVLTGGASRFSRAVANDEPVSYVIPVGLPHEQLEYAALVLQSSRAGLVWRDARGIDQTRIIRLAEARTWYSPLVLAGETWARFDVSQAGDTVSFLAPPVSSPLLRQVLARTFQATPRPADAPSTPVPEPEPEPMPVVFPSPAPPATSAAAAVEAVEATRLLPAVADTADTEPPAGEEAAPEAPANEQPPNEQPPNEVAPSPALPNADPTVVLPEPSATAVLPEAVATAVLPEAVATAVLPESGATAVLPETDATAVLPAAKAAAGFASAGPAPVTEAPAAVPAEPEVAPAGALGSGTTTGAPGFELYRPDDRRPAEPRGADATSVLPPVPPTAHLRPVTPDNVSAVAAAPVVAPAPAVAAAPAPAVALPEQPSDTVRGFVIGLLSVLVVGGILLALRVFVF